MTSASYEKHYATGETTPIVDASTPVWLVTVFGKASDCENSGPPDNTLEAASVYSAVVDATNGRAMEYINGSELG